MLCIAVDPDHADHAPKVQGSSQADRTADLMLLALLSARIHVSPMRSVTQS